MPTGEPETSELQIRCPQCGQRFKVAAELRDRMVECGACENRFRVNDEVTLRTRKFYPGEHKGDARLDRFSRAPINSPMPANFETVNYSPDAPIESFEPPSFQRVIAGFFGTGLMALTGLAFIVSPGNRGPFGDISTERRLILAGFVALIGSAFIIYANRRGRLKAAMAAFVSSLVLIALPMIFPGADEGIPEEEAVQRPIVAELDVGAEDGGPLVVPNADPFAEIKQAVRYKPVEQEIAAAGGNAEQVTAVWLRGMRERHKWSVQDFLLRVTNADRSSHIYPRGDDEFLLVLTGMEEPIEDTARHCRRLGEVEQIVRPLRIIEVLVDDERFVEGKLERLSNPDDDGFYALNLKELESIDLKRVEHAVDRLAAVPPVRSRSDIVEQMILLLAEVPEGLRGKLGHALEKWSQPGDAAEKTALDLTLKLHRQGIEVDEGLVAFLVSRQVAEVQPVLHTMWSKNPDNWEQVYIALGSAAEAAMLEAVESDGIATRDSAVRILGRVGSPAAIPALEKLLEINDRELRFLSKRSVGQIRARTTDSEETPEAEPAAEE